MTNQAAVVKAFLAEGGVIRTRLREQSVGEAHDLLSHPLTISSVSLYPKDVVAALEELEKQGTVVRSEVVHAYDSSEYVITWRIAGGGEHLGPPI